MKISLPIILTVRGNLSSHIQKFEFQTSGESIESEAISQIIDRRFPYYSLYTKFGKAPDGDLTHTVSITNKSIGQQTETYWSRFKVAINLI